MYTTQIHVVHLTLVMKFYNKNVLNIQSAVVIICTTCSNIKKLRFATKCIYVFHMSFTINTYNFAKQL
jgi:hypothetical protein